MIEVNCPSERDGFNYEAFVRERLEDSGRRQSASFCRRESPVGKDESSWSSRGLPRARALHSHCLGPPSLSSCLFCARTAVLLCGGGGRRNRFPVHPPRIGRERIRDREQSA
ncbi:Hypothetical protein NTJ_02023 [Nesidiocoris tenuis]|uniref:Uncharacterized protein n=1 Tax=Nesidiocoris tenuis TaxID=355587 RepID=A0ABN7AA71_9HEMI|nr:Hypothetical protein NTJ_02023 [Nesidiocoris tenuis]